MEKYFQFIRVIMERINAHFEAQKEYIHCKEGCALCCKNGEYPCSELEFEFIKLGFKVYGGVDSPYMWVKIKDNMKSWELFDLYLEKLNIIIIPGIIFGDNGDNYFRVSGLGTSNSIKEAIKRLEAYYEEKK